MWGRVSRAVVVIGVSVALVACGGGSDDDADPDAGAASDATAAGDGTTADAGGPADGGADLAPLPPAPDLVAPQPCDGDAVLCVDASAAASAPDGSAEAPFPTVADALAAVGTGATVQVADGTYAEALLLADLSDLVLLGGFPAGGDFTTRDPEASATVLQGSPDASVVRVERSTGVTVEGFRLTGGGGWTAEGSSPLGGGISIDAESSDVTVTSNRIDGNDTAATADDPTATIGGGIASEGTDVVIAANVVEANTSGRGSGIAVQGAHVIDRNVVRSNTSVGDHGGGIYAAGDVTITSNTVEGNTVGTDYSWGGGIIVFGDDTTATLRGNVVTGNTAVSGGSGVFVDDGANATLVGEQYYANACPVDGGAGLMADSGGTTATEVEVSASTIAVHDCPDVGGGAGVLGVVSEEGAPTPTITIVDSILWGNAGLDVASAGAEITVTASIVESGAQGDGITATDVTTDDPQLADPAGGDLTPAPDGPGAGLGHTAAP